TMYRSARARAGNAASTTAKSNASDVFIGGSEHNIQRQPYAIDGIWRWIDTQCSTVGCGGEIRLRQFQHGGGQGKTVAVVFQLHVKQIGLDGDTGCRVPAQPQGERLLLQTNDVNGSGQYCGIATGTGSNG